MRIKCIVDALGSCGDSILPREHLDVVLDGLLEEYIPVISVIESKSKPLSIGEVKALLLSHETRMKKFHKHFANSPLFNVAQGYNSSSNNYNSQNRSNYPGNHGGFNHGGGHSRGGNNFGRGGGCLGGGRGCDRYANFQCQVCFKFGHTTTVCHFGYDSDFQPNVSPTLMELVFQSNSLNTFGSEQQIVAHGGPRNNRLWLDLPLKLNTGAWLKSRMKLHGFKVF